MAVSYFGTSSNPADNGAVAGPTVSIVPPASMVAGQLVILVAEYRASTVTHSISNTGGQTWNSATNVQDATVGITHRLFWCRFNGTWSANPSVTVTTGTLGMTLLMTVWSPTNSVNTWSVFEGFASGNVAGPSIALGSRNSTVNDVQFDYVVTADDNTWGRGGGSQWDGIVNFYVRNTQGNDLSIAWAYCIRGSGTALTCNFSEATLGTDPIGYGVITIRESGPNSITIDPTSYTYTGNTISLSKILKLIIAAASYTFTGNAITFSKIFNFIIAAGLYTFTGTAVALNKVSNFIISLAQYTYTGTNITLSKIFNFIITAATYTYSGATITFNKILNFIIATAAYTYSGAAITFSKILNFIIAQASYIYDGSQITFNKIINFSIALANYIYTAADVNFNKLINFIIAAANYTFTGSVITFQKIFNFIIATASYTYTGAVIVFSGLKSILIDAANYIFTGSAINFTGTPTPGKYPLTSDQLQIICQFITLYPPPYSNIVTDFINDLYVTGCRPNELLDATRWIENPGNADQWKLTPEKGNDPRYFYKSILSASLTNAIVNQIPPYDRLTLRQLEYVMHRVNPVGSLMTDDKLISAYIFRYNRVRDFVRDGKTDPQVQSIFGWDNIGLVARYNGRSLFSIYDSIPDETFYMANANNDILIDSDNSLILSQ